MNEAPRPAHRNRKLMLAMACLGALSSGLHLWRRHTEAAASSADIGTERDIWVQLTAPIDTFLCREGTDAMCELLKKWSAASSCAEKRALSDELKKAFAAHTDARDYGLIMNGVVRVQMETEDACKAGPANTPLAPGAVGAQPPDAQGPASPPVPAQ